MQPTLYNLSLPQKRTPILISIPHSGIAFPDDIKTHFNETALGSLDDTDFFVDRLYEFAFELGITIIKANYHRWVIDLNRNPDNTNLYTDGRLITSLTPTTDFIGNPLYLHSEYHPGEDEIQRRLQKYYLPYYIKVQSILEEIRSTFGSALLWDAHSIRRHVPTISKNSFPDLILGNNDQLSAGDNLTNIALRQLSNSNLNVAYNSPFKGGNITRHFGNPEQNIHALQLEMTKDCYMKDNETVYCKVRSSKIRKVLKETFHSMIDYMSVS